MVNMGDNRNIAEIGFHAVSCECKAERMALSSPVAWKKPAINPFGNVKERSGVA